MEFKWSVLLSTGEWLENVALELWPEELANILCLKSGKKV